MANGGMEATGKRIKREGKAGRRGRTVRGTGWRGLGEEERRLIVEQGEGGPVDAKALK